MTKHKTRTHTPKPIPAMLEGSFSTPIENHIATLNNLLALEGRLTDDPMARALRSIRSELKEQGVTFERVAQGAVSAPVATAAAAAPKATKAAAPAPKTTVVTKAAKETTAAAPVRKAREIKEEQIETLQVAGTISEAAPYGCDEKGRPLAPYGVKLDGTPMKRRGRPAPVGKEETVTAAAAAAPVASDEPEAEMPEAPAAVEESASSISEDDLDGLLEGL